MTVPSRLDRKSHRTSPSAQPCPAVFPGEPSTQCEGREHHAGPHVARITVAWDDPRFGASGGNAPGSGISTGPEILRTVHDAAGRLKSEA